MIINIHKILSDPEKRRKYDLGEDLDEQQQNPFQHDPFQQVYTFIGVLYSVIQLLL